MKKHILISSGSLKIGGVERLLIEYLNNIDKDKYEITLILMSDFGEKSVLKSELNDNVVVKYLKPFDIIDKKEKLYKKKKNLFYKFKYNIFLIFEKKITLINLKKYLKSIKNVDVFIDFDRSLVKYRNEIKNTPKIIWIHASLNEMAKRNSINISEMGMILKDYEKIIAICDEMKHEIISLYPFLKEKVTVIYNPFDFKKIKEKAKDREGVTTEEEVMLEKEYIVSVSRIDKTQKDFPTLLRAFKLLEYKISENLYIVGEGDGKEELEKLIDELELGDRIKLLGMKKNPFIWIKNSKLFVHSSKYEGFGLVLVEAMILGKPVISSDCPVGPKEILENGKSGLLFEVGNENDLAEKLIRILNDKEFSREIRKNMEIRINIFEIHKVLKNFYDIIENIKI